MSNESTPDPIAAPTTSARVFHLFLVPLAIVAMIASVIGAYYYLNIVRVMFFSDPDKGLELNAKAVHAGALGLAALVMAVGWVPFLGGFGVPELADAAAAQLLN